MKTLKQLKSISNTFFKLCDKTALTKPWAVCLAMHEYARNTYPVDPYIPFSDKLCHTERLYTVTRNLIDYLGSVEKLGYYALNFKGQNVADVKKRTGMIYGNLWHKFSYDDLTRGAQNILKERLQKNGFNLGFLRGKKAIDIGCDSGRFSFALEKLGCDKVVGVDYGDKGLEIARLIARKARVKNVNFRKVNILDLPFADNSFDFVFCNGVLHHTQNLPKGIREMVRVAKKGAKIWLYLYGSGGIFWYARKKMPQIMNKIPQEYTIAILDMIGMPQNRFIFCDNWYVPIEKHSRDNEIRRILKDCGITKIKRLKHGRSTDLKSFVLNGGEVGKIMWGDGELRYILEK